MAFYAQFTMYNGYCRRRGRGSWDLRVRCCCQVVHMQVHASMAALERRQR